MTKDGLNETLCDVSKKMRDVWYVICLTMLVMVVGGGATELAFAETFLVTTDDDIEFLVSYDTKGMTVSNMVLDEVEILFVIVDVTDFDAVLTLTIDRNLLDSMFNGDDDPFIILADGDQIGDFIETETTTTYRTLSIPLPVGTTDVEIYGGIVDFTDKEPDVDTDSLPSDGNVDTIPEPPLVTEPDSVKDPVDKASVDTIEQPTDKDKVTITTEIPPPPITTTVPDDTFESELPATDIITPPPLEEYDLEQATGCGPGTTLVDGVCIISSDTNDSGDGDLIDSAHTGCGPGTTLVDGVCIISSDTNDDDDGDLIDSAHTGCGPGTTLVDGVCIISSDTNDSGDGDLIDSAHTGCGPGTTLVDGVCILAPVDDDDNKQQSQQEQNLPKALPSNIGKEGIFGTVAGFIVAGTVGLILALIARAHRSK